MLILFYDDFKDKQRMIPIHKEEPAENRQRCYGFANISSIEATLLEETYIRTVGLSLATTVQHIHDPSIRFGGNRSKGELNYINGFKAIKAMLTCAAAEYLVPYQPRRLRRRRLLRRHAAMMYFLRSRCALVF